MYKYKLENTKISSETAQHLQTVLLDYHNFRIAFEIHPLRAQITQLESWQSERLLETHQDLHDNAAYSPGLMFLLEDLYSPKDFTQRDHDIDRIFPMMVKLLPGNLLYTVANLIELNLLTQKLDLSLAKVLFEDMKVEEVTKEAYSEAYRICNNKKERLHQIQLIANIGDDLDRYVHSKFLNFTLKMTKRPAEMAGVGALHDFLFRGFTAFKRMESVDKLLEQLITRETDILNRIYDGSTSPFALPQIEVSHSPLQA